MSPITQLPAEPAGNAKETAWFRQVLRVLRELRVKTGPGLRYSYKTDCTLIELLPQRRTAPAGEASPSTRMKILEIAADYLRCRTQSADGSVDDGETLIRVAKPAFLRVTGINGTTRDGWSYSVVDPASERTLTAATAPGITAGKQVIEEVRPSYKANDTIYAIQPKGETSVVDPDNSAAKLTWLDSNVDGRNWFHRRIMLDVCVLVNNLPTQKTVVFSAGPIP